MIQQLKDLKDAETKIDLTTGGIKKPLLYLTLPLLVSNLLQTAHNLIDTFWLGRVGSDALAAAAFVFPIIFLFVSAGIGLSIAGSILVAKNTGRNDQEGADEEASQVLLYISIFSVIMGLIGYTLAEEIITFMGAEEAIIPMAASYLEIISLGMILTSGFSVFSSLLRGYGDTVTPMILMAGSVILNIFIDPILIFGWGIMPELGVEGAAYATLISRGVAFFTGMYILFKGTKGLQVSLKHMRPDLKHLKKTLKLGVPASTEVMARALSVNAVLYIVAFFSTPVAAAYGIVTRIYSAVYLPGNALSRSVETMTAQNHSVGKIERSAAVNKVASIYSFGILAAFGAFCIVFSSQIVGLFSSDPEVQRIGSEFLKILGASFGFMGVKSAYNGGLRGLGKTSLAALVAISSLWAIRVPMAYFSIDFLGETGIWWAFAISNFAGAVLAYAVFKTGNWKNQA